MLPFEWKKSLFVRGEAGLCCDEDGVALGPVQLVEKSNAVPGKCYRICAAEVFAEALMAAYGKPPLDRLMSLWEGIGRVRNTLEEGDVSLAAMKALFLEFPEIEPRNMAKLAAGGLEKYNHNHDPEDGRFTSAPGGADSNIEEMVVMVHKIPKVDRKQLTAWEGGQRRKGYVPQDTQHNVIGKSGVTVGTGVDLGAQSKRGLKNAGVSSALIDKLSPFLDLQKEEALAALAKKGPLELSQEEADELDDAVYNQYLSAARTDYNKDVDVANVADSKNDGGSGIERSYFDDLPSLAQTVILSTRYNMGPNYKMNGGQHEVLWNSFVDGIFPRRRML